MKNISLILCIAVGRGVSALSVSSCKKSDSVVGPATETYVNDFETLWTHFDKEYCYFIYKNIDWNQLHDRYRPLVDTVSSTGSFLNVCASMLAPLNVHVYFTGPDGSYIAT